VRNVGLIRELKYYRMLLCKRRRKRKRKRWYPVMEVIDEVASTLKMDRDVLARASIKAFLEKELRCIEAEIFEIGARHGVRSIFELDDRLKKGEVREANILDDFQELDYLESRRDELLSAMKSFSQ
jgi:hypothetical protein